MAGMTYESIVAATRTKFYNADVSNVQGTMAFQINIEGKAVNGIFYIEIKDGQVHVEPYEYYDRDAMFTCSANTLRKLADNKLDPIMAVTLQKLKVEGNIDKALRLKELIDSHK